MKIPLSTMVAILLITSVVTLSLRVRIATALPRTWIVDDDGLADFQLIQDAINAASEGDTVLVRDGTYHENVVINKNNLTLAGEDRVITAIEGRRKGTVVLVQSSNVTVTGLTIQNSSETIILSSPPFMIINSGIKLEGSSSGNVIRGNILMDNLGSGVFVEQNGCIVSENDILRNNEYGITLWGSSNNVIKNNNISSNSWDGISVYDSKNGNNSISGNMIVNNFIGIGMSNSGNNRLRNNIMTNNTFFISTSLGTDLSYFVQDIDTTNEVDGKLIYYMVNQSGMVIEPVKYPNMGFLALVNCTDTSAKGLTLDENNVLIAYTTSTTLSSLTISAGDVTLVSSHDITLSDCILRKGGIWSTAGASSNNSFIGNYIANGGTGIHLSEAENCSIVRNHFVNTGRAIVLSHASSCSIRQNDLLNNTYGMSLDFSSENSIYHNNFANTAVQAKCESCGPNSWDNGCEGNYWSDYNCTFGTWYGIGNETYAIDSDFFPNMDRCPLLNPYIMGDVKHDAKVNIVDITVIALAYGRQLGDENWDPHADLTEDGRVNMLDISISAREFGRTWVPGIASSDGHET